MRRPLLRSGLLAVVLAIALLAAACGDSSDSAVATGSETDAAASADWSELDGVDVEALAFTGAATDGTTFSGADVVGQDVLLWFWAPW